jgi:hypothetical protein
MAVCGMRPLSPSSQEALACSSSCDNSRRQAADGRDDSTDDFEMDGSCPRKRCSPTCCRISGRCVEDLGPRDGQDAAVGLENGAKVGAAKDARGLGEEKLSEMHAHLLHVHRSFGSRRLAFESAARMQPGVSL